MPKEWIEALKALPPEGQGVIMSMLVAGLRMVYEGQRSFKKIILEILICACIATALASALLAIELDPLWAISAGCGVGLMGYTSIRLLTLDFLKKKASKDES